MPNNGTLNIYMVNWMEVFLIISMLNGKALYCKGGAEGLEVKAAERNDEDESQHWKEDGSFIASKTLNKVFFSQPSTRLLVLIDKNDAASVHLSVIKSRMTFAIKNVHLHVSPVE